MRKKKQTVIKPDYTVEDLKDLAQHLGSLKQTLQDNDKGELVYSFETLTKFLSATYFSPMLFEDWAEAEGTFCEVLFMTREDLPLLVGENNELKDILIQWRLGHCNK